MQLSAPRTMSGSVLSLATPEDWRILRLLSIYRLLLVSLLIVLFESGVAPLFMEQIRAGAFRIIANTYGVAAIGLLVAVLRRWPAARIHAHVHFGVDVVAICAIVHASGGVTAGLGVLVITPAVACALIVPPRQALAQAALAFLAIIVEEFLRQPGPPYDGGDFAATGVLGLMFFGASLAANTVAQRARQSEALAERVGSAFENLSALNETILRTMQTGVLVVDDELFVKTANTAAMRLLGARYGLRGRRLHLEAPLLGRRLQQWLADGLSSSEPVAPNPGGLEIVPRFSRLAGSAPAVLILIDDAASLREQAQQMKLAALGRLSAGIAHEIRNPLSAIMHASQLLSESTEIPWEDRRLLEMVERHGHRIEKIVRDVLSLSRREAANPATLMLAQWLERALAMYHEGFPDQRRTILVEGEADMRVRFDPDHLQQVVFNLINNAFEHAGGAERAVVKIEYRRDDAGRPWMEIRDNGPGIPAKYLERMFEPFFTTSHSGTGLGLYLTRELCEYNQARISYQPQQQGACFRILFTGEG